MPNLQIKGIRDELYAEIKKLAAAENRSISQEVLFLVKEYLARKGRPHQVKTPGQVLLELWGSWEDDREAEEIIAGIKHARKSSAKFSKGF